MTRPTAAPGWFSDHLRGAKLLASLAILLALGGYYARVAMTLESGYRWCMEDPVGRDGSNVVFPLWTVTRVVDDGHYEISKIVQGVPVVGDATPLHVGDTVSVAGTFSAEDHSVHEEAREIHTLRKYKEGLGVIGLGAAVLAAPMAFRIRDRRIVPRG